MTGGALVRNTWLIRGQWVPRLPLSLACFCQQPVQRTHSSIKHTTPILLPFPPRNNIHTRKKSPRWISMCRPSAMWSYWYGVCGCFSFILLCRGEQCAARRLDRLLKIDCTRGRQCQPFFLKIMKRMRGVFTVEWNNVSRWWKSHWFEILLWSSPKVYTLENDNYLGK